MRHTIWSPETHSGAVRPLCLYRAVHQPSRASPLLSPSSASLSLPGCTSGSPSRAGQRSLASPYPCSFSAASPIIFILNGGSRARSPRFRVVGIPKHTSRSRRLHPRGHPSSLGVRIALHAPRKGALRTHGSGCLTPHCSGLIVSRCAPSSSPLNSISLGSRRQMEASVPEPPVPVWSPRAVGFFAFFLAFPAGLILAVKNWLAIGRRDRIVPHVVAFSLFALPRHRNLALHA